MALNRFEQTQSLWLSIAFTRIANEFRFYDFLDRFASLGDVEHCGGDCGLQRGAPNQMSSPLDCFGTGYFTHRPVLAPLMDQDGRVGSSVGASVREIEGLPGRLPRHPDRPRLHLPGALPSRGCGRSITPPECPCNQANRHVTHHAATINHGVAFPRLHCRRA